MKFWYVLESTYNVRYLFLQISYLLSVGEFIKLKFIADIYHRSKWKKK